ncbi:hypothetical protein M2323_002160 [Rhodoblastus acidophilus]|uniref:hypothetical protein n=1 Tax=Rhodoblastus acidophilus TaxID=1074 RepID=UPI0022251AF9|nr:hypothetical protein [Rhodoblastus acidophilus]MCW2284291.1 hypothetical protein [Rhodoblastus acidophilus]MCW2333231.1 hypothetical protein [Rhodoblastus acidophilus]
MMYGRSTGSKFTLSRFALTRAAAGPSLRLPQRGLPFTLCICLALLCFVGGIVSSKNLFEWMVSGLTVLFTGVLLRREINMAPPIFLFISLYWSAVAGDILVADLDGAALDSLDGGVYRAWAIYYSWIALLVLAVGVKMGFGYRAVVVARMRRVKQYAQPDLRRAWAAYGATTIAAVALGLAARAVPSLAQPITAIAAVRLVALYILAHCLKRSPNGLALIAGVMLVEGAFGTISYIASFQIAFFTIIAALLVNDGGRSSARASDMLALTIAGAILVFFAVVWTAVKPQFRELIAVADMPASERLSWVLGQITEGRIDYGEAAKRLVERVSYTKFFALLLERQATGLAPDMHLWRDALTNVLMPRVFFPDKAILDDTAITTMLTGVKFGSNTSVSIGYVAEASADFGPLVMSAPLALLGFLWGRATRFFLTADVPMLVASAFVAAVWSALYKYESNSAKILGGFALTFLAMFVVSRLRSLLKILRIT